MTQNQEVKIPLTDKKETIRQLLIETINQVGIKSVRISELTGISTTTLSLFKNRKADLQGYELNRLENCLSKYKSLIN